jgi:hypothetical protein
MFTIFSAVRSFSIHLIGTTRCSVNKTLSFPVLVTVLVISAGKKQFVCVFSVTYVVGNLNHL